MFYTVYKTTNKVNGKVYIGCHKTKNLDDGYLGSGKLLGRSIEKYGIENFEKEILAVFDKSSDMFNMESELVNEDFVERSDTYNLKQGGYGGWDHLTQDQLREYNSRAMLKMAELKESDTQWYSKYCQDRSTGVKRYYKNHPGSFTGKKHTDEYKKRIGEINSKKQSGKGNSQYGTMWIHNKMTKENKKINKSDSIPEGWEKGRKMKF